MRDMAGLSQGIECMEIDREVEAAQEEVVEGGERGRGGNENGDEDEAEVEQEEGT
ncbi:hypothetical protein MMC18_000784 [Xylographa bjoerkii]|nr:hypothetical protein [Xylographa bjoerkii]